MATGTDDVEQPMENHAASISRITSDVLHEILLRLPISSLLRFLRVCHQWRDVIRDPFFVTGHTNHAPEQLLLFLPRVDASASHKTVTPGCLKHLDGKWSVSTLAASSMDPDGHLFASCNGLLCFYRKYTLKIVNPTTRQCLHLSKPDGKLFRDLYYLYSFGFHSATGEYKLIYFHHEPQQGRSSGQPFCFDSIQVYTLGEDRWREITAPKESRLVNLGVVNVDGAMYWITEDEGLPCCGVAVMRFDLKDETFVSLRPPPLKACEATDRPCDAPDLSYYVTEVDRNVCLVTVPFCCSAPRWRRYNAEVSGKMDIWMLESQAEDRWILRYSIDLPASAPYFVPQPCFIRGEKILLHDRDGDAFCRDLRSDGKQTENCSEVTLLNFKPHWLDASRLRLGSVRAVLWLGSGQLVCLSVRENRLGSGFAQTRCSSSWLAIQASCATAMWVRLLQQGGEGEMAGRRRQAARWSKEVCRERAGAGAQAATATKAARPRG